MAMYYFMLFLKASCYICLDLLSITYCTFLYDTRNCVKLILVKQFFSSNPRNTTSVSFGVFSKSEDHQGVCCYDF